MKTALTSLAGALLLTGTGAYAHHSAAEFDFQHPVNVSGVVKEARFSNPHAHVVLEVSDERGTRDIVFEGHSRNNMYRQGFRPEMLEIGDKVTIRIAPKKNGNDGGYIAALLTADGTPIGNIAATD